MENKSSTEPSLTLVATDTARVVAQLAALAQPTRLDLYRLLVQRGPSGLAAGELAAWLDVPPATLSFHLKELAHAGLVQSRPHGRFVVYSANFAAMNALLGFLSENCCAADDGACPPAASASAACAPAASAARSSTPRKVNL
jgi:DNA-binding transcriptional ArsR family regulator